MNSVNMTGRLTADPEMNFSLDAVAFTKFRIAVRRYSRKDEGGQKKDVSDFFNVIVWNRGTYRIAELCITHLTKGDRVGVHGRLEQDDWKTPSGETRERVVIKASDVDFLDLTGANPARSRPGTPRPEPAPEEPVAVPDPAPALVTVGGSDGAEAPATAAPHVADAEVVEGDPPGSDPEADDGPFRVGTLDPEDDPF